MLILRYRGASGFVRTISKLQSAQFANVVQIFCPFTTYSSPSLTARHLNPVRSDPAAGSLKSSHHSSSPYRMGGSILVFGSSVACEMIVGPTIASPMSKNRGALCLMNSSIRMN